MIEVQPGAPAVANFDLGSTVYTMGEFVVTGEREGNALAITSQRNAENLKNVVALDAFGNLPNMSAGELAVPCRGLPPSSTTRATSPESSYAEPPPA